MKVDLGFWNEQGEYIPDIQEIDEREIMQYKIDELEQENKQLKAERDLLLTQLVILDGVDVTVQITQEQFDEYNKLKARLDSYEKDGGVLDEGQAWADEAMASRDEISKLNKCLDEIEKIAKWRVNYDCECVPCDDAPEILRLIKEVKGE